MNHKAMLFNRIIAVVSIILLCTFSLFGCSNDKSEEKSGSGKDEKMSGTVTASEADSSEDTDEEYNPFTVTTASPTTTTAKTEKTTSGKKDKKPEKTTKVTDKDKIAADDTTTSKASTVETTAKSDSKKPATTTKPTGTDGSVDLSCFDNSAFVGNSRMLSVDNFGLAKHVYAKVGLTVKTVFTESCEGSSVAVIDELKGKDYENVFLMFGDNECGWGSMEAFENEYVKVINAVKERVPGAKIYVISILPISQSKSNQNTYGYSKSNIDKCNKSVKNVASTTGSTYLDAASAISDASGYLPAEASSDGCHLKKEYTIKWLQFVADNY